MLVYVVGRAGRAGVKDEIKFNFLPAPSFFFTKEKKTELRLMMVLDSCAGVGWHSEHWDAVAERPN